MEAKDSNAAAYLLAPLKLIPVNPKGNAQRLAGVIASKPNWVLRPNTETTALFVEADPRTSDGSRGCMHGRIYLWSMDGKIFFLYRIIT
ncbi:MAG: hypothetical protein FJY56_03845 [Betaproteobacteria bacterium]|nr:hypothetical protein [Betaproteobacteria bacterium]